jgi:hypothetical protein
MVYAGGYDIERDGIRIGTIYPIDLSNILNTGGAIIISQEQRANTRVYIEKDRQLIAFGKEDLPILRSNFGADRMNIPSWALQDGGIRIDQIDILPWAQEEIIRRLELLPDRQ